MSGQPIDVQWVFGEVFERSSVVTFLSKFEKVLTGEVLVLWDVQVLGFLGRDPVDLAGDQVAKMPDGGLLVAGQVGLALGGQEVVDLETDLERL